MNYPDNEDFHLYFNRIRPIYHQLFNIAYAVSGNAEQAEYCLQYALLDCWQGGENSHRGLRDALRRAVIRKAIKNTDIEAADWNALRASADDPDIMRRLVAQENTETRRILALKYGCGLSSERIARIMGVDSARVRQLIGRFEARTRRRLPPAERRKYDMLLHHSMHSFFAETSPFSPEMNSVFRSFQADAVDIVTPSKLPMRIVKWIFALLLTAICIVVFWLAAVLIQPPALYEAPQTEITETLE